MTASAQGARALPRRTVELLDQRHELLGCPIPRELSATGITELPQARAKRCIQDDLAQPIRDGWHGLRRPVQGCSTTHLPDGRDVRGQYRHTRGHGLERRQTE